MSRADSGNPSQQQQDVTSQLRDKASEVASNLRDMGNSVRGAASEQYQNLRDTAQEYYQSGRDKAAQWEGQLEDYVREQPLKSLLIAAGVGVVLGILWKRS
ncbi:MAG TPA: hypothetical protein VH475_22705 [Tepidisphaeraceae bacterium]|jgi:ElaB/YqjD/DUF883 family membrane-anchored ribosome-binding protein